MTSNNLARKLDSLVKLFKFKIMKYVLIAFCFFQSVLIMGQQDETGLDKSNTNLDINQAAELIKLPMNCICNPLPYKSGHVLAKESDLAMPQVHHPAFYGCFDWHSAVHGHWSIVYLLKKYPVLTVQSEARDLLNKNLTQEAIEQEIAYFSMSKYTESFERTYGWAWLLKLGEELKTWDDPDAQRWYKNLEPLCELISKKYVEYLPKLVYPIRVGEHTNTAFGLTFAYDYAVTVNDAALKNMIAERAKTFYMDDAGCPISWEPSGYDFLSPCLQEMDIMRRVLDKSAFVSWLNDFLPAIKEQSFSLEVGKILDRSDGKLVHLDGLNFSRAWCLFSVAQSVEANEQVLQVAEEHLRYSLTKITDGDYAGEHWLASFALYALKCKTELEK